MFKHQIVIHSNRTYSFGRPGGNDQFDSRVIAGENILTVSYTIVKLNALISIT